MSHQPLYQMAEPLPGLLPDGVAFMGCDTFLIIHLRISSATEASTEEGRLTEKGRHGALASQVAFAGGQSGPGSGAEEGGFGGQAGQPLGPSQLQQGIRAPHQDEHGFQHGPARLKAYLASELYL